MEKISIGPSLPNNLVDLDTDLEKNIKSLSDAKNTTPDKLTICVLKRPRHEKIITLLNSCPSQYQVPVFGNVKLINAFPYAEEIEV